jgi:transposase
MIRILLGDATRDELRTLRRTGLPPKVRDRIAMVTRADAGGSAPRIAGPLGCHPQAVRDRLRAFQARGTEALYPGRRGPAPGAERRDRATAALRELRRRGRTWTSGPLSRALSEHGIALGARPVRRYRTRRGARYRRTGAAPRHHQDPAKAGRAGRVLENLKAGAAAGRLALDYRDGCGVAPTPPTASSRALPGARKRARDEAPQGRRVHALAADRPYDRSPRPEVFTAERTWDADDLLGFRGAWPRPRVPRVVVLDHAGLHTGG